MFWDKFGGRWLRHKDFFYPDRPENLPTMKEPPNLDKFLPENRRQTSDDIHKCRSK
jgi:hypothetical protein